MSDRRCGDWRVDHAKILYAFCRKMHVLPSQVLEEDPIIMNSMLLLFAKELERDSKNIDEMKASAKRR